MSDDPENLVLVYLRRIDARQERMEREMSRHFIALEGRMSALEGRMTGVEARMTAIEDWSRDVTHRLDRIERRLEIADAPM